MRVCWSKHRCEGSAVLLLLALVSPARAGESVYALYRGGEAACQAVIIAPRAAMTAGHCANAAPDALSLSDENGRRLPVQIVAVDPAPGEGPRADLAVLRLSESVGRPIDFAPEGAAPTGLLRLQHETTPLAVIGIDGPLIFATARSCEGHSGSPAVDVDGRLVAILIGGTATDCTAGLSVFLRVGPDNFAPIPHGSTPGQN